MYDANRSYLSLERKMLSRPPELSGSDPVCRPAPAPAGSMRQAPALDSTALLAGGSELTIRHGEEIYRLRLTRQNRLILTK
jgi:hemin uptake protein HemP